MITHFDRDNLVKNLPDAYRKTPDSNNAKILEIEHDAMDVLREAVAGIADSLDLDKAYGKTLDLYGEMIGQDRGEATDEQYRVLIRSKIVRAYADADHNSIINAICATFGCDPAEVLLTESGEPGVVLIEGLPVGKINKSNIGINTAIKIIFALMPAGVQLEALDFSGTFAFGTTAIEHDPEHGFGNIEQTTGGYFGLVSDGTGDALPV